MNRIFAFVAAVSTAIPSFAQQAPAQSPNEARTSVNANGTIAFRYRDAGAQAVEVNTDAAPKPLVMQKGADGIWTATSAPLKPEHYGYSFHVDGVEQRDPTNAAIRPNLRSLSSEILVPGSVPQPWEMQAIPHGALTRFVYTTHTAQNLPLNQEPYIVYTPPNYDPKKPGGYPMLALLHGWSDDESGWATVGQANLILDTLLAERKIEPMVVVMPLGYGDYHFVTGSSDVWNDAKVVDSNVAIYSDMLLGEILPAVQHDFAIAKEPEKHAIAGLSMGGLQAISIGLNHPEMFRYVAGMSAAVHHEHFDEHFPAFAGGNGNSFARLKLLWVACGTEDGLITPNRHFVAWAKSRHLPVTSVEVPGQHSWLVWRDNLLTLAPLLFR